MPGETQLVTLLRTMRPVLQPEPYVFCSIRYQDGQERRFSESVCQFKEAEGLTLVLTQSQADAAGLSYTAIFAMITLTVHSSLEAVGFLAAITTKLASAGISVNPISAYYHDHLFVPQNRAQDAMALLEEMTQG